MLENVDRTHLVLASGTLLLQKNTIDYFGHLLSKCFEFKPLFGFDDIVSFRSVDPCLFHPK